MTDCKWAMFIGILKEIGACVFTAQENVETAALGHILRGTQGPVDHATFRKLVSRDFPQNMTFPQWSDVETIACNGPSYTAAYRSTIVSAMFKDMMIDVDAVHVLLRHPGPAYVESAWSPLSLLPHAPKESGSQAMTFMGHLEVLPLDDRFSNNLSRKALNGAINGANHLILKTLSMAIMAQLL